MHCQLRSADRTLFDGEATMIVARSPRGEFAILGDHAPLLAVLAPGVLRIQSDTGERVFVIRGGILRTTGDVTTLLVESGLPVEEIDLDAVRRRLTELDALTEAADGRQERDHLLLLQGAKERHG